MIAIVGDHQYRFWLFGIPVTPEFYGKYGTWFPRFARDVTYRAVA